MTALSTEYKTFCANMMSTLCKPAGYYTPIVDQEATHVRCVNEEVNLYRHFLLLRDDLRYHVMYNEVKPKNLTRYVHKKYPSLVKRIKDIYYRRGLPHWDRISTLEQAGINVVWDSEERKLQFHVEGSILTV